MRTPTIIAAFIITVSIPGFNGLYAQICDSANKMYPGAVIVRAAPKEDTAGMVIQGCIKMMNESEMYVAPKLTDSTGNSKRYYGREAIAYWYINHSDTVYYLNGGRNLRSKWLFLKRLVKGPMELYVWQARGTSLSTLSYTQYHYYYLRRNNRWVNEKPIVWNESGNRKQLNSVFADCPAVLEQIARTSNLVLDEKLTELVGLYNTNCARASAPQKSELYKRAGNNENRMFAEP